MGYCIDEFLEDSGLEKACEKFFQDGNYKSEDGNEFISQFFFDEFARICQMERPIDCDYRFGEYRRYFILDLFKSITGGDSESISLGERLSLILHLVEEHPISLKYVATRYNAKMTSTPLVLMYFLNC